MLDKETFRKTEKKLYIYYDKDNRIASLKYKIELLERHVEQIENDIRTNNVTLEEESHNITYEERVQTSFTGSSYAERAFENAIEKLEREKEYKLFKIRELRKEIRDIEEDCAIIEYNMDIKKFSEEVKKFLRLKYKEKLKHYQIGMELMMSDSTVSRMREKLVEDVARWEQWNNKIA